MFGMSQSSSTSSRSPLPQQEYELHVPTKKDFVGLCELQDLAFEEKRGWCQPITDCRTSYQHAYEFYSQSFPDKLQHCRIIVDNGVVIGGCQLQFPGDPGDMSFCADGMRRDIHEGDTYAYVEWIACHPDHTGKGIGSVLLQWAMEYCRQMGLRTLSLQVGGSNERAIQLYERHGFVTATQPGDDCIDIYCLGPVYVYCCLGFKHHSLVYMERRLMDAPTTSEFDEDDDVENERSFKDGNKKC
ncbi:acyl-CoA N-acyltransferase [Nitzschia inconspicua]|uniref:Acyl-CoA N-acyltransferase n=1 Tax=Nitzschia inconspicua TaxID=303405 RepID=A0A9K3KXU6_9STRA|nr:acyl-CoA N-acyltransferase [Nitzschia inconspicua]